MLKITLFAFMLFLNGSRASSEQEQLLKSRSQYQKRLGLFPSKTLQNSSNNVKEINKFSITNEDPSDVEEFQVKEDGNHRFDADPFDDRPLQDYPLGNGPFNDKPLQDYPLSPGPFNDKPQQDYPPGTGPFDVQPFTIRPRGYPEGRNPGPIYPGQGNDGPNPLYPGNVHSKGNEAFTVRKASTARGYSGQRIRFLDTVTNVGFGWNNFTSEFVCQSPGIFYFSFTACGDRNRHFRITLKHNTVGVVSAYGDQSGYQMASNTALIRLFRGDRVYLELDEGTLYEVSTFTGRAYNSFTGFRIL